MSEINGHRRLHVAFEQRDVNEKVTEALPYRTEQGAAESIELTFWADPGSKVIEAWTAYTSKKEALAAAAFSDCLVDDDGLPARYLPPRLESSAGGGIDREHPDFDARYDDEEQWSSRRRFRHLSASTARVYTADLIAVVDAIVKGAVGGHPTSRSTLS